MPRLRNISGADMAVFYPPGTPNSMAVKSGEYLEIKGEPKELADAWQVGDGDDARLYPKALWQIEKGAKTKSAETKAEPKNGNSTQDTEVR